MKERILSVCLPPNKKMRIDEGKEVLVSIEKVPRAHEEQQKKKKAKKRGKKIRQLPLITPPDLSMFAICWVKVRGFKDWPGVIESCVNGIYTIHFFGDYTRSTVTKKALTNFYEGFSLFSHTFDTPDLSKAIKEACICLMKHPNPSNCLVCDIFSYRMK